MRYRRPNIGASKLLPRHVEERSRRPSPNTLREPEPSLPQKPSPYTARRARPIPRILLRQGERVCVYVPTCP